MAFFVFALKNYLYSLKDKLKKEYLDEKLVYKNYIEDIFKKYSDIWDISAAFSYYNYDKRIEIKKQKYSRKRINSKDVHIATQFFTPKWIVQYIIDNSVGSFFQIANEDITHKKNKFHTKIDIKIFDPAIGTGNMFFYTYDLLEKEYIERGFDKKEIPKLILSSFYGLDIDKRAVEIAKKLLLKKAGLQQFDFNIYYFEDVDENFIEFAKENNHINLYKTLILLKHNREIGSIIKLPQGIEEEIKKIDKNILNENEKNIINIINILIEKYDVIVMNPPYLASSDYNDNIKEYVFENYKQVKQDLFAVFIMRAFNFLKKNGYLGIVCPYNWMFIKSFTYLREYIIKYKGITNLMQLSFDGYSSAVVFLSAFVLANKNVEKGLYIKLTSFKGKEQEYYLQNALQNDCNYKYIINQARFLQLPYYQIIYWTSEKFIDNFKNKKLKDFIDIRQGMATGNNKKFLKKIEEVDENEIAFSATSIKNFDETEKKYALYNKGGKYRKWYGNINYVINFEKDSRKILEKSGNRMPSREFYFKECITWTLVSSKGKFGARYSNNSVFDVGGSCGFFKEGSCVSLYVVLGFLCSNVASYYLNALNPTLNVQVGDIKNLPFIVPDNSLQKKIEELVKENISLSKKDWYNRKEEGDFEKMKKNEETLNKMFIEFYGLENEIDYGVEDRLITIKRSENEK